jgi:heat shock protein HslJ
MRNTLIISPCLTLFAFIGTAAGQQNTLNGTSWKLIEANGTHVRHSSAALVLNSSLTMFSGNTGCNQMSGTLSVRGRKIDFGRARTTKRFCKLPEGSIPETTILNGLENTRRFDLHGGELRLLDRRGRVVLRFARDHDDAGTDQVRLDGVRWVLESIKGRQTYVPLPYAFIKFDAKKGSAGGDTSCNVFGGDYSVKGSRITFSNIISTMRACVDDDAKMATERDLLDGLQQADRFELRDDHLFLYRGREILLNFRAETKQRD